MKKALLFSAVFSGLAASAQTFTAADTLQPGMSTVYYVMDSSAASMSGVVGTGVTWDYSALVGEMGVATNTDNVILASAAPAPHAATFTDSEYNDNLATFASIF